jgi:hypothetical protein
MSDDWTAADVTDQTGRVAIVTGANAGVGLELRVGETLLDSSAKAISHVNHCLTNIFVV